MSEPKKPKTVMGCLFSLIVSGIFSAVLVVFLKEIATNPMGDDEMTSIILVLFWPIAFTVFCFYSFFSGMKYRKEIKKEMNKPFENPYVDVSLYNEGEQFPVVNYPDLILKPQEHLIYAVPANLYTENLETTGYTSGSSGVSVRVAKGMSVRTGGSRGRAIKENVRRFQLGDYVVTDQRVLFISTKDSFELSFDKITAVKLVDLESFTIMTGNKQKNICVHKSQTQYAYGMLNFAIKNYNSI